MERIGRCRIVIFFPWSDRGALMRSTIDDAAVTSKRTGDEACMWELINRTERESLNKNAQYASESIVEFHLKRDNLVNKRQNRFI